ncbi:MAG: hypothetical protein IKV15_07195 [Bacteroidaceae bacterium]|nr:hypothetical protein [Bacteroidaceae bacterium]
MAILFNYFFAAWQVLAKRELATLRNDNVNDDENWSKAAGESVFDAVKELRFGEGGSAERNDNDDENSHLFIKHERT